MALPRNKVKVETLAFRVLSEMASPEYQEAWLSEESGSLCDIAHAFLGPDLTRVFEVGGNQWHEKMVVFKCENGLLNKYDVFLSYFETGMLRAEEWRRNNYKDRVGAPAEREWHPNGMLWREYWFTNGKQVRDDGPVEEYWHPNGQKSMEVWKRDGVKHREDGPALSRWRSDGTLESEAWYIDAERIQ